MPERPVKVKSGELATILRVYPEGKLPRMHIPIRQFARRQWITELQRAARGAEVVVEAPGVRCGGRIVALVAVVELDRETEQDVPHPGQAAFE